MFKRTRTKTLLIAVALVAVSGIAIAGGNTIASSAKSQTLVVGDTRTIASGLSDPGNESGERICATIVNRSENTAVIQLTLTDVFGGTDTMDISKAKSSALCRDDSEAVSVMCLGPKKCAFTWSVDKF